MNFLKKLRTGDVFMIILCIIIIFFSEYLFLTGNEIHGIFVGLWPPTLLAFMILIKTISNGSK